MRTAGEVLPDGTILELVLPDPATQHVQLLVCNANKQMVLDTYGSRAGQHAPIELHPTVLSAIRFPTGVEPHGSAAEILASIRHVLGQFVELPERTVTLIASFVLHSWFSDVAAIAPFLWISGPFGPEATSLMRLLHCLCRRPLLLGELRAATFFSLPLGLRPTLLIQQPRLETGVQNLLRASSDRKAKVAHNGSMISVYCAKAIHTAEPLGEVAPDLCSTAVHVAVTPSVGLLPFVDDEIERTIASEFQPRLLGYRIQHLRTVETSKFDASAFSSQGRLLARSLGACIVDAPLVRDEVLAALRDQDEQLRLDSSLQPESVILEALLAISHEGRSGEVLVGEITDTANAILRGRGESFELEPREVGGKLRSLGILTRRLGSAGRGVMLLEHLRRDVHRLARSYGVRSLDSGTAGCSACQNTSRVARTESARL